MMAAATKSKSAPPAKPARPPSYRYTSSGRTRRVTVSRPARKPAPAPATQTAPAQQPNQPSQKPQVQQASTSVVSATKIERSNYQSIILMEYVGAVLLTAATPVATRKGQPGLSPYAGKDIAKLAAITLLYLILAMLSVGGRGPGRFAAWFGGLILIADGMYEASNLVKDFAALSGGLASAVAAGGAPPSELPTAAQQAAIEGVGPAALNLPPAVSGAISTTGPGPAAGKFQSL